MPKKLPTTLKREPLVEAVFEVRLVDSSSLAEILPGILFQALDSKPRIERLPVAEIPKPIRDSDPNLLYAPTLRLELERYFIALGDRNIVIACKLPYPKWPQFKQTILDITQRIAKAGVTGKIARYSVKYANLIQAPTLAEQVGKIKMSVALGPVQVESDNLNMQVHRIEGDITHILSVVIGAQATLPEGKQVNGALVSIDSIRAVETLEFAAFADGLEPGLEELRQANKAKFFNCLKDTTIAEMEPTYE